MDAGELGSEDYSRLDADTGSASPMLEQYKMYVEMTDRIASRRTVVNNFYITITAGILAYFANNEWPELAAARAESLNWPMITVGLLGVVLNAVWWLNIRSFRQLAKGKYTVIQEMEAFVPYPCYKREWEILGGGKSAARFLQLSTVELWLPAVMVVPFVLFFILEAFS